MGNLQELLSPAPLSLAALVINLLLSLVLSSALAWYYTRYGKSLSNRAAFAQTLPVLALTTTLVITIIKSSLALSLGLVGALSIVRFRTAIKEPEELLHLFIAIAIGLGMGADQRLPTILAVLLLLSYLIARTFVTPRSLKTNLYFNVLAPASDNSSFAKINDVLFKHVEAANLRRLDRSTPTLQATYLIACPNDKVLVSLMDDMNTQLPGCEFSFVEQDNTLGG
jgi:hypothetical protein